MKTLFDLYEIHSPSRGEKRIRRYIKNICLNLGCSVKQDSAGNLLVTKGKADTYPCIVSHMDQVQFNHSKDFTVVQTDNILFGYSPKCTEQQGLGADDKNGIWICLKILQKYPAVKCAFFVGEEIGCVGSLAVDLSFFSDCRFILQADRKNGHDLITSVTSKMCSDEFLQDINYSKFGYVPTWGLMTDVDTLTNRGVGVSCVNISCGYYRPHTSQECTNIDELQNCLNFIENIVENCIKTYTHVVEKEFCESYSDEEMMSWVLEGEPDISFKELTQLYSDFFISKSPTFLYSLYRKSKKKIQDKYLIV